MNTIRAIEGTTLISIGAFCAAAVTSIVLHGAHILPSAATSTIGNATSVQLAPVVVSAKRLTSAQKATVLKALAIG
jgi:hypothetical protein